MSVPTGQFILGDGSGGGAGGSDWGYIGGNGGNGGGSADTLNGSIYADVIFGDGSGGGAGGKGQGASLGGSGGSGADTLNGGAGNDILFGDGFDGQDNTTNTSNGANGGLGGGGGGGQYWNGAGGIGGLGGGNAQTAAADGTAAGSSTTYYKGGGGGLGGGTGGNGSLSASGGAGGNGNDNVVSITDTGSNIYNQVNTNLAAIAAGTYQGTGYGMGAGADVLDGGSGNDNYFGMGGADTFVVDLNDNDAGNNTDTIWDYTDGTDKIRLENNDAKLYISQITNMLAGTDTSIASVADDGTHVTFSFANGSALVVKNTDLSSLSASDFLSDPDPDGLFIMGDGSGGGGGGGYEDGGNGGHGGGGADTLAGSAYADVIFGDGSGGGGGAGRGAPGGTGGGGADEVSAGAGNDVLFGDGFDGLDNSSWHHGTHGGLGGGGGGGQYWNGAGGIGGLGGGNAQTAAADGTAAGSSTTYYKGGGGGLGGGIGGTGSYFGANGGNGGTATISLTDSGGLWHSEVWNYLSDIAAGSYRGTGYGMGAGNDTLDGETGDDQYFGMGGADTFVVDLNDNDAGNNTDTIWDYADNSDKIRLQNNDTLLTKAQVVGLLTGTDTSIATMADNGADTTLTFANGSSLLIKGALTSAFSAADFGFTNVAPTGSATATLANGTEDNSYTVDGNDLLQGFTDADGDRMIVDSLSSDHGTVTDNLDNSFTISAEANYFGTVNLSYNVIDNNGGSVAATQSYTLVDAADLVAGATSGNDVLTGTANKDILNGLGGDDTMTGGNGSDVYSVNKTGDVVVELLNEGTDKVNSSINYTLTDNVENLTLIGNAAVNGTGNALNNVLTGNAASNTLSGLAGADTLDGKGGADIMAGGQGKDKYYVDNASDSLIEMGGDFDTVYASISFTLANKLEGLTLTVGSGAINATGNAGNNYLTGNESANTLSGGLGADNFVLSKALGASNVDTMTDFVSGTDTLRLDNAVFAGLGVTGRLGSGDVHFTSGSGITNGQDSNDRIILNTDDNSLWYDVDGVGGTAAVQFAVLNTIISDTDIVLF